MIPLIDYSAASNRRLPQAGSLRCSNGAVRRGGFGVRFLLREKQAGHMARVSRTRLITPLIRFMGSIYGVCTRMLTVGGCDKPQQNKHQIERQMNKGNLEKIKCETYFYPFPGENISYVKS